MAKFDPPEIRARLAVKLLDLRAGMVIQDSEGTYQEIRRISKVRPLLPTEESSRSGAVLLRDAAIAAAGGRDAGKEVNVILYDRDAGYQTRPHAGQLRAGDVILAFRGQVTVQSVEHEGDMVLVSTTSTIAFGRPANPGLPHKLDLEMPFTASVRVAEWGS